MRIKAWCVTSIYFVYIWVIMQCVCESKIEKLIYNKMNRSKPCRSQGQGLEASSSSHLFSLFSPEKILIKVGTKCCKVKDKCKQTNKINTTIVEEKRKHWYILINYPFSKAVTICSLASPCSNMYISFIFLFIFIASFTDLLLFAITILFSSFSTLAAYFARL